LFTDHAVQTHIAYDPEDVDVDPVDPRIHFLVLRLEPDWHAARVTRSKQRSVICNCLDLPLIKIERIPDLMRMNRPTDQTVLKSRLTGS